MFNQAVLMVTGGTGSFGHHFIRLVLRDYDPAEIVVFSRDEKKQHDMRQELNDPRVSFVIGDVRDRDQVMSAMRGVDFVFHAAALKQVPSCEFFPMEAVQTNVLGANNVLSAAEACGVRKLVVLSTDKAVYPINAMGMSKALMEKLVMARARTPRTTVLLCAVRYGNVMYSRGSVIPLFVQQAKQHQPLSITDPDMTRLLLPLSEAVKLVTFAMEHGQQGDLFVRKAPAATVAESGPRRPEFVRCRARDQDHRDARRREVARSLGDRGRNLPGGGIRRILPYPVSFGTGLCTLLQ